MGCVNRNFLILLVALAALSGQQDQSVAQERVRIALLRIMSRRSLNEFGQKSLFVRNAEVK